MGMRFRRQRAVWTLIEFERGPGRRVRRRGLDHLESFRVETQPEHHLPAVGGTQTVLYVDEFHGPLGSCSSGRGTPARESRLYTFAAVLSASVAAQDFPFDL